jgi:hypothetical protein
MKIENYLLLSVMCFGVLCNLNAQTNFTKITTGNIVTFRRQPLLSAQTTVRNESQHEDEG